VTNNWRAESGCEKYCANDQIWSECSHPAETICPSLMPPFNFEDDTICVGSCICPDGLYKNIENICVKIEICQCAHNGELIQPGEQIHLIDETCSCDYGILKCTRIRHDMVRCPLESMTPTSKEVTTCHDLTVNRDVSHVMCECPDELLYDKEIDECVIPSNCGCYFRNSYYEAGPATHNFMIDGMTEACMCFSGKWTCDIIERQPSECRLVGQQSLKTFDGLHVPWNSACSVQLLSIENEFSIYISSENVLTISSSSYTVTLDKTTIRKYRQIGMLYRYDVTLGATIMWDGENMLVLQISGKSSGKSSGICGNGNIYNNGIPNDDLVTNQGVPATVTDMFMSYISKSLK